jgi:hypothetical protein
MKIISKKDKSINRIDCRMPANIYTLIMSMKVILIHLLKNIKS